MENAGMIHLNLLEYPEYFNEFLLTCKYAASLNDELADNYNDIDLYEYDYMSVCMTDRIIAFSGLMKNRWGKGIGRVATRLWVDPEHRMIGGRPSSYNSKIMMPAQTKFAEENGYNCVFFSREKDGKHFDYICKRSTDACPHGYTWRPAGYTQVSNSSWQHIAVCSFTGKDYDIQYQKQ